MESAATGDPLMLVLANYKATADKKGSVVEVPWDAINNAFANSPALNSPSIDAESISKRLSTPDDPLNQWLNSHNISNSDTGFKISPANAPTDLVNDQAAQQQIDQDHQSVRASAYRQLDRDRK